MKLWVIALVTVALLGCSKEKAPLPTGPEPPSPIQTAPEPPAPPVPAPLPREVTKTSLWVVVIQEGEGFCVDDASIEIVAGQGAGRRITQTNDCSYWDPDYNAVFTDLNADEKLTLRAAAPGYASKELSVTTPGSRLTIELARTR